METGRERTELSSEDIYRAHDRWRIAETRRRPARWRRLSVFWLLIGPGILVMLGENDAPSMLSYAATGSQYGLGFFVPFVLLTFAMAYIVQEMTVRLGTASHRGHAELIFDRFGRFWGVLAMGDLLLGNFLTLVTEFIGIRAGLGFFGVPALWSVLLPLLAIIGISVLRRYWTWERAVLLLAMLNFLFVPVAILAHPSWSRFETALFTWRPLPGGLTFPTLTIILADIGATVTPWMLFFQQSAVVDKGLVSGEIRHGRLDTFLGALFAAVNAIAAIVATASLFGRPLSQKLYQSASFAQAIQPYVGHLGAALFALGITEAGLVAAITISTSSAYAFGEVLGQAHSLNRRLNEARAFYLVLILSATLAGLLVLWPGARLESIVLIVNVLAVLAMPPALLFLVLLVNDPSVMGGYRNSLWQNILVGGVGTIIAGAGILYGLASVFPRLLK